MRNGLIFSYFSRFAGFFLGMGFTIVAAKTVAPEVLGNYSFTITVFEFLSLFSLFGLGGTLFQRITGASKDSNKSQIVLGIGLVVVIITLLSTFGSTFFGFFHPILICVILHNFNLLFHEYYRATGTGEKIRLNVDLIGPIVKLSILGIALYWTDLMELNALLISFGSSIVAIFLWNILQSSKRSVKWPKFNSLEDLEIKESLQIGFFLVLNLLIFKFINRVDILLIKAYLTESDIGIYHFSHKIANVITFSLSAVASVLPGLYFKKRDGKTFSTYLKVNLIVTLGIFLGILLFQDWLFNYIGTGYENKPVMYTLMAAFFIQSSFGPLGIMLNGLKKHKLIFYSALFSIAFNVLVSIILQAHLGLLGIAIGTMAGFILLNLLQAFFIQSHIPESRSYFLILTGISGVLIALLFFKPPFMIFAVALLIMILIVAFRKDLMQMINRG